MVERLHFKGLGEVSANTTEYSHLAGYRATFTDDDPSAGPNSGTNTAMTIEAIWVRNESGGTLAKGAPVTWDTAGLGPGRSIGGVAGDDAKTVGIVDPYIAGATVADDYYFWLIVKGPTKVRYDGSSNLTVGTEIKSAGSGNVSLYTFATDDADSKFGVTLSAKTSGSAGDLFRALIDCTV